MRRISRGVSGRDHIKGRRLALPAGVALRYAAKLDALVRRMHHETTTALLALYHHPDVERYLSETHVLAAMDISPSSQARILTNQLKEKFEQLFNADGKPAASDMAKEANNASAAATASSLRDISARLTLSTEVITGPMREFTTAAIGRNVALIKSIPQEYFQRIQDAVFQSLTDGKGLEDLVPALKDIGGITERRAKNIAIDQTHKMYQGLNAGRMKAVGVKSFEWVHSGGGQHPRQMHIDMSGKIYDFNNLPVIEEDGERGIPGQAINCRCTMIPVVRFEGEEEDAA